MLGLKNSSVSNWEQGNNTPDVSVIFKLCQIFKISVADIFGADIEKEVSVYSSDEKYLISTYRRLNSEGKTRLNERAEELVTLGFASSEKGDGAKIV